VVTAEITLLIQGKTEGSMLRYILLLTVTMCAFSSVASSRNAQINKITLKERRIAGEVPYQISNIAVNGEFIEMNSSFFVRGAGDEWEKKLTFDFVNTSNKYITYLDIQLMLPPEDKSERGAAPHFFWFKSKSSGHELFRDVPDLKPGETLQIKLQERYYDSFQKMVGSMGLSNSGEIKEVIIWVNRIGFSDGTVWGYGRYYRPDPNDPTKRVAPEPLRSGDGRSSASLSSPSPQLFCPTTRELGLGLVFCASPPPDALTCQIALQFQTPNPGPWKFWFSHIENCLDDFGRVCGSYPSDSFTLCP
jgi:hypothetical protein